jgi:nucleoid-associated protein YgaU
MTMKTIFKPLLFLLTVLLLHSAEATVQKEGNPYTVKSGDTLYDIAQAYYGDGNRWQEIAQANGIDVNNPIIVVGSKLNIPNIPQ